MIISGDNEDEINQIMIDNLSPFSKYQIFIRPMKNCDYKKLSETVFFTTSGKYPIYKSKDFIDYIHVQIFGSS